MRADEFFAFARKRHAIHMLRQLGEARPWTDDSILATYRFTNVFRELDRTTIWFRERVRDRLAGLPAEQQVMGTILFRTFNRIETGEELFCQNRLFEGDPIGWYYIRGGCSVRDVEGELREAIPKGPWATGAYIVKTPDGMDKLRGALWIVEEARKRVPATLALIAPGGTVQSLEGLHRALVGYPFLGGFTAYEIVSDLRWLPVMGRQPYGPADVMTWAHAGPGAQRGLNRLAGEDLHHTMAVARRLELMRQLLWLANHDPNSWPADWPRWEMREVEHTLCEWDKYERVVMGQGRPRGVYR